MKIDKKNWYVNSGVTCVIRGLVPRGFIIEKEFNEKALRKHYKKGAHEIIVDAQYLVQLGMMLAKTKYPHESFRRVTIIAKKGKPLIFKCENFEFVVAPIIDD